MASKKELAVLELDENRLAWEAQPWETSQAFLGFAIYRDLGPQRSLVKAGQVANEKGMRKGTVRTTASHFGGWSAKYRWLERAQAYDLYMDARYRDARENAIDQANRRYAAAAARMSGAALRKVATSDDAAMAAMVDDLDFGTLALAIKRLQEVELRSHGQALGEVSKGMFSMSNQEIGGHLRNLVKIGLQFVAPEVAPMYHLAIKTYFQTGEAP